MLATVAFRVARRVIPRANHEEHRLPGSVTGSANIWPAGQYPTATCPATTHNLPGPWNKMGTAIKQLLRTAQTTKRLLRLGQNARSAYTQDFLRVLEDLDAPVPHHPVRSLRIVDFPLVETRVRIGGMKTALPIG